MSNLWPLVPLWIFALVVFPPWGVKFVKHASDHWED